MSRKLSEQTIVITGASSGIGRETALQAGRSGAAVVLAARSEAALGDVAKEIQTAGGQAHTVVTDVSDWEQVQRLALEAMRRFRRIDTWVNNAATSIYGTFEQTSIEEFERIIQVDLMGMVHGTKAILPYFIGQHEGTIINVGSVVSERAFLCNLLIPLPSMASKGSRMRCVSNSCESTPTSDSR